MCSSNSSSGSGRFCEVIGTRVLADSLSSYLLAYKLLYQWLLSNNAFATLLLRPILATRVRLAPTSLIPSLASV